MQIRALIFGVWLGVYDREQGTLLAIKEVGSFMNGKLLWSYRKHSQC